MLFLIIFLSPICLIRPFKLDISNLIGGQQNLQCPHKIPGFFTDHKSQDIDYLAQISLLSYQMVFFCTGVRESNRGIDPALVHLSAQGKPDSKHPYVSGAHLNI